MEVCRASGEHVNRMRECGTFREVAEAEVAMGDARLFVKYVCEKY